MSDQHLETLYNIQIARQLDPRYTPDVQERVALFNNWCVESGHDLTVGFARYMLFDHAHTHDVVNETYLRVHAAVQDGKFTYLGVPFTAYVKRVVYNVICEMSHDNRRILNDDELLEQVEGGQDPYHEIEVNDTLTRAVRMLTGNERHVIHEWVFNHRTIQDIAALLGLSVNNVSQIKGRALQRLYGCL